MHRIWSKFVSDWTTRSPRWICSSHQHLGPGPVNPPEKGHFILTTLTFLLFFREAGIVMPVKKREQMKDALQMPISTTTNLTDFLEKFGIFVPVLVYVLRFYTPIKLLWVNLKLFIFFRGNEAAIRRISYEFCEDLKRDNIIYAEARMCPQLLAKEGTLTSRSVLRGKFEVAMKYI